jgi:hypothetical protein
MRHLLFCLFTLCSSASAQVVRIAGTRQIRPQLSVGSLSLTASPSVLNISLVGGGPSVASTTLTINNQVSLTALGTFSLYASFASTSALTDIAGDTIPTSAVYGKCGSSTTYTPFTQVGSQGPNNSLLLYQTSSIATLILNSSQSCIFMINLTSLPQLPAGQYSGTLEIQAQAF